MHAHTHTLDQCCRNVSQITPNTYVYTCAYMHAHIHICTCSCSHACTRIHKCTHMHILILMHIHTCYKTFLTEILHLPPIRRHQWTPRVAVLSVQVWHIIRAAHIRLRLKQHHLISFLCQDSTKYITCTYVYACTCMYVWICMCVFLCVRACSCMYLCVCAIGSSGG